MSMDWFRGKMTGNLHSSWENRWFPGDFPLNQFVDGDIFGRFNCDGDLLGDLRVIYLVMSFDGDLLILLSDLRNLFFGDLRGLYHRSC